MTPAESLSASMTPVKPMGTLITPVELVGAPMMPFEPERNDNLYPDCLPSSGHQAHFSQPPGSAFTPSYLHTSFSGPKSTLKPRPNPVLWAVCRSSWDNSELKEVMSCEYSLRGQPQVPTLGPPSSLLEAPRLSVDSVSLFRNVQGLS